jgi:hypothetical protein
VILNIKNSINGGATLRPAGAVAHVIGFLKNNYFITKFVK